MNPILRFLSALFRPALTVTRRESRLTSDGIHVRVWGTWRGRKGRWRAFDELVKSWYPGKRTMTILDFCWSGYGEAVVSYPEGTAPSLLPDVGTR